MKRQSGISYVEYLGVVGFPQERLRVGLSHLEIFPIARFEEQRLKRMNTSVFDSRWAGHGHICVAPPVTHRHTPETEQ